MLSLHGLSAIAALGGALALPALAASPEIAAARIEVRLDPEAGELAELAGLRIRGDQMGLLRFAIDPCLTFETVRSSSPETSVEGRKIGGAIEVRLDPPVSGEITLTFRISGRPKCGAAGTLGAAGVALGSTDGWYPSLPGAIAEVDLALTAPADWAVLATGAPSGAADSAGVRRFRSTVPVAGIAFAGAPGLLVSEAPLVRERLRVAGPPGAADGRTLAPLFADPFAWLSAALAPYPFDGVNLVFLPGLDRRVLGSGLVAVPARTEIVGPEDAADLLSGQWFGERVIGDGAWMEALAAWQAVTYAQDRGRPLPREIQRLREEYLTLDSSREASLAAPAEGAREAVVRGRGSAAPDMVRLATGDRQWLAAVRAMAERPVGSAATLDDLRRAAAGVSGRTPEAFREWFERAGIPRLRVTFRTAPAGSGGYRADVRIDQPGLVFHLPVDLAFYGRDGGERRETVELTGDTTAVYYLMDFEPLRLEVDPLGRLFQHAPERLGG